MPSAITFKITDVGRTAALDADTAGLDLRIAEIAIGSGQYTPDGTETALVAEIERWNVADGDINVATASLRFSAILESSSTEEGFEIGLFDEDGVLFAVASTVAVDPLIVLNANIAFVGSFGLKLTDIPSGVITVEIDPSAPLAVVLLNQHNAATDPHPQYVTKVMAAANGMVANLANNSLSAVDINTVVVSGTYQANLGANRPFDYFILRVYAALGGFIHQQAHAGDGMATRYRSDVGVWSAWKYYVSTNNKEDAARALIDLFLPVGTVLTYTNGTDPNIRFGGTTWVRYAEGMVGVGYSTNPAHPLWTKTLGNTQGAFEINLSVAQLPPHKHISGITFDTPDRGAWVYGQETVTTTPESGTTDGNDGVESPYTSETGSGDAISIVQPSIVEARWVRTA